MENYLIALANFSLIYMLLAAGLNLQYGFTGLVNFGHVGFYAIGAYAAALAAMHGLPLVVGLGLAIVVAAVLAAPLGILSLRLSDDYLAVVTLGFSEVVRLVITNEEWLTKGTRGIAAIPPPFDGWVSPHGQPLAMLALLIAINVGVFLIMRHLVLSPFGRTIKAIRDDEVAVKAVGKEPTTFKVEVFMIGAAIAGLAGGLQAHYLTYISPEQFLPIITFYVWMAVLIGGAGTLSGTIVGTLVLLILLEGSRFLRDAVPSIPQVDVASLRIGIVGLALILFTLYRPEGLMGKAAR